jgi:hypothetical protein
MPVKVLRKNHNDEALSIAMRCGAAYRRSGGANVPKQSSRWKIRLSPFGPTDELSASARVADSIRNRWESDPQVSGCSAPQTPPIGGWGRGFATGCCPKLPDAAGRWR